MKNLEDFEKLLSLSETILKLANSMNVLSFAARKGWVDKSERLRLKQLQNEEKTARLQADLLWRRLQMSQPLEFKRSLARLRETLHSIWEDFQSTDRSPEIPRGEFNSSSIPVVLGVFSNLLEGKQPGSDRYWALAVADQIIRQQKT